MHLPLPAWRTFSRHRRGVVRECWRAFWQTRRVAWSPDPDALRGRVAVVAGATRGAGRGIAAALGEAGATVVCTGRSSRTGALRSDYDRPETIEETAELVTELGGTGDRRSLVDHLDPDQVRAAGRADPERPRPHRRARQRHLGRRGAQGRSGRLEHADLGARPRQGTPDPPARHRHPPHHVAPPPPAPRRPAGRPASSR